MGLYLKYDHVLPITPVLPLARAKPPGRPGAITCHPGGCDRLTSNVCPYLHVLRAQHATTNRETRAALFLTSQALYRILPRTGEARCQTIRCSRYGSSVLSNSDQTDFERSWPRTVGFLYMRCTWFRLKFRFRGSMVFF